MGERGDLNNLWKSFRIFLKEQITIFLDRLGFQRDNTGCKKDIYML